MEIRPVAYRQLSGDPEWDALVAEYAEECALPELGPIAPQMASYEAMEQSGSLQWFGAYSGVLVGFISLITWTVPHYGKTIVSPESIFLSKRHRRNGNGAALLDFVLNYGRAKSACMVQITTPVNSRLGKLLSLKPEFRHSNNVFVRSL